MRPEDQYIQALLAQPAVSTITLADGGAVAVEQIYVPRTLLHEVKQKEAGRQPGRGQHDREEAAASDREVTVKLSESYGRNSRMIGLSSLKAPPGWGRAR